MAWFRFNKKKKEEKRKAPQTAKEKVEENLFACKQNKNKLLDKRDEIRRRINETINTSYFVPGDWWYKELNYYNEIKALPNNKLLSEEIRNKCDEIVNDYNEEIKIIDVQIEHYDYLISTYLKTLDKIYQSKDDFRNMISELQKMRKLEKYDSALSDIKDTDTELLADEILQEEKYKGLKDEIETLAKDLDTFEEYVNQLKKLK